MLYATYMLMYIEYLHFIVECTIPKLDVVFVLDTFKSIKDEQNFGTMKDFIKNTADLININVNDTWASVMLFSDKASIRFPLTEYTDLEGFRNAVEDMKKLNEQAQTHQML